jgi:DNA-binding NarL/FixJ family response regulator
MGRVLLGNLEPIVRLGLATVLRESGAEIIEGDGSAVAHLGPDAVVLDLARESSRSLAKRIQRASPETTVVFWPRDEQVMEVLAPGAGEPRRVFAPRPDDLCAVMRVGVVSPHLLDS